MGISEAKPGMELYRAFQTMLRDRRREFGRGLINLSEGNPAFDAYPPAVEAAEKALRDSEMRIYANPHGSGSVCESLVPYCESLGLSPQHEILARDHILPGCGTTHLYVCALEALGAKARKEHPGKTPVLLMTAPTYGLFATQPESYGFEIETLSLRAEDGWKINPEALNARIAEINASPDRYVAALYRINPSNPMGVVETHEESGAIARVLRAHDVFCIDDLAYLDQEYEGRAGLIAAHDFENAVTLFSLSKTYCAPALRAGFACGPKAIIGSMGEAIMRGIQSVPLPAQRALMETFRLESEAERRAYIENNMEGYKLRHQLLQAVVNGIETIPSLSQENRGAIEAILGRIFSNRPMMDRLLAEGIPDVSIVNPDLQSGYFSMLRFDNFRGLHYGTLPLDNTFQLAAALVDQGKILTLPAMSALGEKEVPGGVRVTFGKPSLEQLARGLKGLVAARQALTEKPNPVLQDQLARDGLILGEAFA